MSEANPNANVTLSFAGLALYNFNTQKENWEFLFMRHVVNHDLIIKIKKFIFNPQTGDKDLIVHTFCVDKGHKIYIDAEQAIAPDAHKYLIPDFEFDANNQKEDIRWMEELSDLLGEQNGCSFNPEYDKNNLTFLSIEGKSILYTKELTEYDFNIYENTPSIRTLLRTRRLGEVVAADIEYPLGEKIRFRIEGVFSYSFELDITENTAFEIKFDNSCVKPECEDESDFKYYYDLLNSPGRKIEVEPILPERDENGVLRGDGVPVCRCTTCKKFGGIVSLEELI